VLPLIEQCSWKDSLIVIRHVECAGMQQSGQGARVHYGPDILQMLGLFSSLDVQKCDQEYKNEERPHDPLCLKTIIQVHRG